MSKTRKASDVVELGNLPKSKAIWSMSITHPLFDEADIAGSIANGSAYAETNKSHDKGQSKKVTQFASDKAMKNLLDDGFTKDRDRVQTLKYNGDTLRWLTSELGDDDALTLETYALRGFEILNKADDLIDSMCKLIETSMNAANVDISLADFDTFAADMDIRLRNSVVVTSNKLANIRSGAGEVMKKARKYGV